MDPANSTPPADNPKTTPPPEKPREDDKPKSPDWPSLSDLISAIAVFFTVLVALCTVVVFLLSCMNLSSIEATLGFYPTQYLDFIDYVQSVSTLMGTVAGVVGIRFVAFVVTVIATLVCMGFILDLIFPKRRSETLSFIRRALAVVLSVFLFVFIGAVFYSAAQTGNTLKETLRTIKPSTVFRKSGPCPVKGALFLHSSRYIFLWMSDDNSVVAIPNVEVEMIQTPSNLPGSRGTPTPSPTASTPK